MSDIPELSVLRVYEGHTNNRWCSQFLHAMHIQGALSLHTIAGNWFSGISLLLYTSWESNCLFFSLFNFKVAVYCLYVDLVCAYVCVYIYVEELSVKLGIINWILGNQSRKKIPLLLLRWSCGKAWQGEKSQAILNPGSECWLWTSSGHYEKLCGHQKSYEPKSKSKELKGQEGKENQSHCKLYKSVKEF